MVPVYSHLEKRRKVIQSPSRFVLLAAFFAACFSFNVFADEKQDLLLEQWLGRQSQVETWQADFVQTRKIPALVRPLISEGKVYFKSPAVFRWQIGEPPKTIALRSAENVTIYYPLLKRAERYPLEGGSSDPWKDALAMLDAGFPQSREELDRRFELKEISIENGTGRLLLQPRSYQTRKFLTRIELTFDPGRPGLISAEFEFGDGTILRNDFTNGEMNLPLESSLFELPDEADIQITYPGAK
jgi:outer membrane lipoprotein-sorting protein